MMHEQLQIMDQHADTRTWLAANAAFHATVYRCAARPRMIELVERLRRLTDRYMYVHIEMIGTNRAPDLRTSGHPRSSRER